MHSGTKALPRLWWLARSAVLALALLPAWRPPAAAARERATLATAATQVTAPAPPSGSPGKSVHEFSSCFLLVLGVGGILLAFSSGLFAPVLALVLVSAAWEVCS